MNKLKIGIVGVGQRGYAYVNMTMNFPDAEVAAICDTDSNRLEDFAKRLGCTSVPHYNDITTMLENTAIDAVIITVPDFLHASQAIIAFQYNKHVLLEKPMAPTTSECREIIKAHNAAGTIFQLGFVLRNHSVYQKIKEIVDSGRLGQIMSVAADESIKVMHGASYMRRWHRRSEKSGGFMLAKCSHDLDALSWIIGSNPARVASFGSINFFTSDREKASHCSKCSDNNCRFRFGGEMVQMSEAEKADPSKRDFDLCVYNSDKNIVDNQVTILEYQNGVRATFSLNLFAPVATRTMKIVGSEGYLLVDTLSEEITITSSINQASEKIPCPRKNDSSHGGSDLLLYQEFLDCIRTGKQPQADYRAGLAATLVGNAIEDSRINGKVVNIPSSDYL